MAQFKKALKIIHIHVKKWEGGAIRECPVKQISHYLLDEVSDNRKTHQSLWGGNFKVLVS